MLAAWRVMTALLLRASGLARLEQGIEERRAAHGECIAGTHAFIPGPQH
jgi:steroid 5-alpha reductase family enzyme